jgi:ribosome-binding ATPase YchF (GTP1/OBG family)
MTSKPAMYVAMRLEAKDYVVRDGDVMHVRFNV